MRELTHVEMEMVGGGVAPAVVVPVVVGVIVLASLAVAAYAIANDCSATLEIGENGLKLEVTCPGTGSGSGSGGGG